MESLDSALSSLLGNKAKNFEEDDLELLLGGRIKSIGDLQCVSRATLRRIRLADILIDHLLKAQQGVASFPLVWFSKICLAQSHDMLPRETSLYTKECLAD